MLWVKLPRLQRAPQRLSSSLLWASPRLLTLLPLYAEQETPRSASLTHCGSPRKKNSAMTAVTAPFKQIFVLDFKSIYWEITGPKYLCCKYASWHTMWSLTQWLAASYTDNSKFWSFIMKRPKEQTCSTQGGPENVLDMKVEGDYNYKGGDTPRRWL